MVPGASPARLIMAQTSLPPKSIAPPIILRPTRGLGSINLKDLWAYRELIYFLIWRDIKVRYKQTLLGASWAVIQPVFQMVVYTLLFGNLAQLDAEGNPYPIFNFTALLPWGLFQKALNDAGRSLVSNRNMITKVYFPRLVIPISSVVSGVVDFAIGFCVLVGMIVYFHNIPGSGYQFALNVPGLLMLPFFILFALFTALGFSLWLSAMNVIYRDIAHVLPFITQMWFFITPIVYSSAVIPEKWRFLYALNPMVGVVDGFRWALLGKSAPEATVWISVLVTVLVLVSGLYYFRRMERTFADTI
jgi:lipopolysaccharide transport system permease protein